MFERSHFMTTDDDAGVGIDDLGRALVTWTAMQDKTPTVADAAMAFNTSPEIIREAVEDASWIFVSAPESETDPTKQRLELDGE